MVFQAICGLYGLEARATKKVKDPKDEKDRKDMQVSRLHIIPKGLNENSRG